MGTVLNISNPNLSFMQWITAIHFPGATGGGPPPPQIVYCINGPGQASGIVTFNNIDYPYGAANLAAPSGQWPAITDTVISFTLEAPGYAGYITGFPPGGDGSNSPDTATNGFTATVTWKIDFAYANDLIETFAGGFYTDLAVVKQIVNDPDNQGLLSYTQYTFQA